MTTCIGFRFLKFLYMELFMWLNYTENKFRKFLLLYVTSTHLTCSTLAHTLTLKIYYVAWNSNNTNPFSSCIYGKNIWSPLIILIQFKNKKQTNKTKTKHETNKQTNKTSKKHAHASVYWFGTFHQLTVPGFICKFTLSLAGTWCLYKK